MLAAFGKRLFNALLFAEVPLADELDLHARVRCQFLGVFANAVPERLRKSGIVENPNVSLEQKGGHPSGKTDLRQGSENQHSVPATQYARNLVPVPFRQQLHGHPGIIASLLWFRLRRLRVFMNDSQAALSQGFPLRDMLISMPFSLSRS